MKEKEPCHKLGQKNKNVDKLHLESPLLRESKCVLAARRRLVVSVSCITFLNVWEGLVSSREVILHKATKFEEYEPDVSHLKYSDMAGHLSHNLYSLSNVCN